MLDQLVDPFQWLAVGENGAISLLKEDHDRVKELFDRFEKAKRKADKRRLSRHALEELRIHATLEEEIFYPAVRRHLTDPIMDEADEEHHVAKILIAELEALDPDNDHYDAKFTVLAENVRHHIKEEEHQMLPKASDLPIDFEALHQRMQQRRQELKSTGRPVTAGRKSIPPKRRRTA